MNGFSVQIRVPISEKNIGSMLKALESETEFKKKAEIAIGKEKGAILIHISSGDVSSLHAATGSMLRAVKIILSVANAQDKISK